MPTLPFTVIADGRTVELPALVDPDAVRLSPAAIETALGWRLEREGLCRDGVCVPLGGEPTLVTAAGIDLERLASLLDRPLALDREEGVAALGESAARQRVRLDSLAAPDFSLPDLDGRPHRLSDHRGRKVFLLAWASW